MAKNQREKPRKKPREARKTLISFMSRWNYLAPELKLTFILFLIFCSLATIFQFLPFFTNVTISCPTTTTTTISTLNPTPTTTTTTTPPPPPPKQPSDEILPNGVIKRSFYPIGTAAYNFVLMSAYRGGPNTFAVIGLSSKPLHNYGHPTYTCEYQSQNSNSSNMVVPGNNLISQDFGYARVYLVVVVNCTFPHGTDPSAGGRLLLHASTNGGYDTAVNETDTIIALSEVPNSWTPSSFSSPPKYDYLYCGGSLFGELSPQRVREWMAYHVMLFGKKSHFVLHDAGGINAEVMEVLKPWIEVGFVTVEDVKEEGRFDAFYHNQMVILNDCLHRHRFATKWMFFFDLDEYVYLPKEGELGLQSVMDSLSEYSVFVFEQVSMSNRICLDDGDPKHLHKKWGFEKLVYRNTKKMRKDMKYAIQPRNVFAAGIHFSENYVGKSTHLTEDIMTYYHYHGAVAERREPCRQLVKDKSIKVENTPYVLDNTLTSAAPLVKRFELDTIGSRLQSTRL